MKILIGDDHRLFRDGLKLQLRDLDAGVEVVGAADFDALMALASEQEALDLVLVDLGMPGMEWRQAIRGLSERFPDLPVVVVSASDDHGDILEALENGAAGYIPKSSSGEVMVGALQLVLSGGTYLPPEVLDRVRHHRKPRFGKGRETEPGSPHLTPRQREVLGLLAKGQSNKEIAAAMSLSESTVKLHITAILKALDANNRTQAVLTAARLGLVRGSIPASQA